MRRFDRQLAAMPPVVAGGCERAQFEPAHRGDDIESGLAFDADRLKGKRVLEATDQAVGGGSDTHGGSAGSPHISAGQRTRADVLGSRKDGPAHDRFVRKSDLSAKALDGALIVLGRGAARWGEDAVIRSRRVNDVGCCAGALAAEHPYLDGGVRWHRGKGKAK